MVIVFDAKSSLQAKTMEAIQLIYYFVIFIQFFQNVENRFIFKRDSLDSLTNSKSSIFNSTSPLEEESSVPLEFFRKRLSNSLDKCEYLDSENSVTTKTSIQPLPSIPSTNSIQPEFFRKRLNQIRRLFFKRDSQDSFEYFEIDLKTTNSDKPIPPELSRRTKQTIKRIESARKKDKIHRIERSK